MEFAAAWHQQRKHQPLPAMLYRPSITIPQPCHEKWAQMTPAAQGRHCAACDKVVMDFTRLTDAEVIHWLQRPKSGRTCGRFATQQLNRPLLVLAAPAPRWQKWVAATVAVVGLQAAMPPTAQAQSTVPVEQRVITMGIVAVPRRVEPLALNLPPTVVRGVVTDETTGEGLPGVTVLLKNTSTGTSTNSDGTFELEISVPVAGQVLVFSSIGYISEERNVGDAQHQEVLINLSLDTQVLGELVVVRKPWPWHPRAVWYKVRNAFR